MAKLLLLILEGNFNNKLRFILEINSFIINKIPCLLFLFWLTDKGKNNIDNDGISNKYTFLSVLIKYLFIS